MEALRREARGVAVAGGRGGKQGAEERGGGRGEKLHRVGPGGEVLGRCDVWGIVSPNLSLLSRMISCRVCKAWKEVGEGSGLDYSVASLCCALASAGTDSVWVRLEGWWKWMESERMCDLITFLREYPFLFDRYRCPETWMKLALLAPAEGWVRKGAVRTRLEFDWGACELGWGRIHWCAVVGDAGGVREELARGVDADLNTRDGLTPLLLVVKHFPFAHFECVRELLKGGANPNAKDSLARTPLHYVAERGDLDCVRELVRVGAEIGRRDGGSFTPLYEAATHGHLSCLRELLVGGARIHEAPGVRTVLHGAAMHGHVECMRELLGWGADVGTMGMFGETPLHWAARSGSLECVRELLRRGADVRSRTESGELPSDYAARSCGWHSGARECLQELEVVMRGGLGGSHGGVGGLGGDSDGDSEISDSDDGDCNPLPHGRLSPSSSFSSEPSPDASSGSDSLLQSHGTDDGRCSLPSCQEIAGESDRIE